MADFCKQCSIEIFKEDFKELADIAYPNQQVGVICEGCGYVLVDEHGACVDPNCSKHGETNEQ